METFIYAHENGCPWDEMTRSEAAPQEQRDTLIYAHENGCPWDADTCTGAAENGHLEVLIYAHEKWMSMERVHVQQSC
jgi:hypothetical protein